MSGLIESWTGLSLRDPWLMAAAIALTVIAWRLRSRGGSLALGFAPASMVGAPGRDRLAFPRSWRMRLLWLPRALLTVGLLAGAFALARPVVRVPLPLDAEGIDILLCMDVSSSMTATDLDPQRSRLDVAKQAAASFVDGRQDDRIGLVRFARYPDLACPPTLDHDALRVFLLDTDLVEADGPEDMTGIGTAVARAAAALRQSLARSKVVILLTDGEENVATAETPDEIGPSQAARLCEELGVRVYTIAVGIGRRDLSGGWVPLDTTQVRELAESTAGKFFEARDAGAVEAVYGAIDELERVEFAEPRFELEDRFLAFLLVALALVLAGRWLEATVLRVLP